MLSESPRPEFQRDGASVLEARLAAAGRKTEATQLLQRAKSNPWSPFAVARVYAALGEPDSAFVWLDRSVWKWPHRAASIDPALDPLRFDPRFARLVERVERETGLR